ncbi:MAG TPA: HEPN domain-containing protein [Desulfobulbaceae bacterium]|nr:HEPN domain-containing protein [Desulfobulbaceae bacterium]
MPHRKQPGSAFDWLARAQGDLAIASATLPEGAFLEDLCFHAQQAAEKALKAISIHHDIPFLYTHDLDKLTTDLKHSGIEIPPAVEEATILTTFAWEARYPGTGEPVTQDEYKEAVAMAGTVVEWAVSALKNN